MAAAKPSQFCADCSAPITVMKLGKRYHPVEFAAIHVWVIRNGDAEQAWGWVKHKCAKPAAEPQPELPLTLPPQVDAGHQDDIPRAIASREASGAIGCTRPTMGDGSGTRDGED